MAYAFTQDVPIDSEIYAKIMERVGAAPLEGCLFHAAVRLPNKQLRYIDVWESEEACDRAFAERIEPAVGATFRDLKFRPDGEPAREILDIVDLMVPHPVA